MRTVTVFSLLFLIAGLLPAGADARASFPGGLRGAKLASFRGAKSSVAGGGGKAPHHDGHPHGGDQHARQHHAHRPAGHQQHDSHGASPVRRYRSDHSLGFGLGMLQAQAARRVTRLGLLPRPPRLGALRAAVDGDDVPTAAVLVAQTLVSKACSVAVPYIEELATTTPIPAQEAEHYSFPTFNLSAFALGAVAAAFEAPNQVHATFTGVNLTVPETPFFIFQSIFGHKFGCHGTFSATVENSALDLTMDVSRSPLNGSLIATNVAVSATFGALNIQHTFESDICKIAGDVLGVFFGGLNNLLQDLVQDELPAKLASIVRNKTNEFSGKSPLRLAAEPNVTSAGLELLVSLTPSNATPSNEPMPSFAGVPGRDVEALVSEAALNTVLALDTAGGDFNAGVVLPSTFNTSSLKSLLPAAYGLCQDCNLMANVTMMAPPFVTVAPASFALAATQVQVAVSAFNASTLAPIGLFTLSFDAAGALNNVSVTGAKLDTIRFDLALDSLSATVVSSNVGALLVPELVDLVAYVVRKELAKFNANFGGITLPTVDGFSASNVVLAITEGQIALAADLDVPAPSQIA